MADKLKLQSVITGYATHHKFANIYYLACGFHQYPDERRYFPEKKIIAKITFPSWEFIKDNLHPGDEFLITEVQKNSRQR